MESRITLAFSRILVVLRTQLRIVTGFDIPMSHLYMREIKGTTNAVSMLE